jgi:formate dehydrogenase major subunit
LQLNGKTLHQIAVPYHFGTAGLVQGGAANDLLAISGEPNVTIMEAKALTCNVVPGRLPRGPEFAEFLKKYASQTETTVLHPEEPPPGVGGSGGGHAQEGKE